jgi:hypothetical protein
MQSNAGNWFQHGVQARAITTFTTGCKLIFAFKDLQAMRDY